jgi:hypothetical protein
VVREADLGFTRDRPPKVPKSAKADLGGAVAVDVRVLWRNAVEGAG